jgi:hypothetical protein
MGIGDLIDVIAHLTGYAVLGGLALYYGLPWLSKHWKKAAGFILLATAYYAIAQYSSQIWAALVVTCVGMILVIMLKEPKDVERIRRCFQCGRGQMLRINKNFVECDVCGAMLNDGKFRKKNPAKRS